MDTSWLAILYDHLQISLGPDWFWSEAQKPDDQMHIIVRWFKSVCEVELDDRGHFSRGTIETETPATLALRSIAYDLLCVVQMKGAPVGTIERLKGTDSFEGARYQLWVAASFLRAGFQIEFEDETDRRQTHCEFTATYPRNGARYSVEAKRRHRRNLDLVEAYRAGEYIRLDIQGLISAAVRKNAAHPRIIFVDVNMLPPEGGIVAAPWVRELKASKEVLERQQPFRSRNAPWAFLLATNHPYHYLTTERPDPRQHFLATCFNHPAFYKDPNIMARQHPAVLQLMSSIRDHFAIPDDFVNQACLRRRLAKPPRGTSA